MKPRNPERPVNVRRWRARLAKDPQTKAWAKRISDDGATIKDPRDLPEEQLTLLYAEILKRRHKEFNADYFVKAMAETAQILAAPDMDDPAGDLALIWAQPEMLSMWERWQAEPSKRGPKANLAAAKALMTLTAMRGASAHLDDNYDDLAHRPDFQNIFAGLEQTTRGKKFGLVSYDQSMALVPRLALECIGEAHRANARMIRELKTMFPGQGILKRLVVDGTRLPLWAQQKSSMGDPDVEAELTRRVPEAKYRAYTYSSNGKVAVGTTGNAVKEMAGGKARGWRGAYLVTICDGATGLWLCSTVIPADNDEVDALIPLLSHLYELYPELAMDPPELAAADAAFDEKKCCRLTELHYGFPLVARHHADKNRHKLAVGDSRDGSIWGYTNKGQLICAQHGKALEFASVTRPSRKDLRPGRPAPSGAFRIRATCPSGCGKPGVRMELNWRRLTAFPHHPHGRPELYAMRKALELRVNTADTAFQRLKTGDKLAMDGQGRCRLEYVRSQEALISLAFLSMTAMTLADQRQRRGIPITPISPGGGVAPAPQAGPSPAAAARSNGSSGHRSSSCSPSSRVRGLVRHPARAPAGQAGLGAKIVDDGILLDV